MQWIDGFERADGMPHLAVLSATGERELRPFKHLRSAAPKRAGSRNVSLSQVRLEAFEECSPQEYLELAGFPASASPNHRVYALLTPEARLLVPAAVMMLALFPGLSHIAPYILSAASLDRLAVPSFEDDTATVTFFPGSMSRARDIACTQERFLWLTGFSSARRTWNSVSRNAGSGLLAIDMPKALADGSAHGLSRGDIVLVNRLHLSILVPTEPPLAGSSLIAGRPFEVGGSHTERGTAMRHDTLVDLLPRHSAGTHLTDGEWNKVRALLGARTTTAARRNLDEILLKLISGRSWDDINRKADARNFYFRLQRLGRWDGIRELLIAERTFSALA